MEKFCDSFFCAYVAELDTKMWKTFKISGDRRKFCVIDKA